MDNIYRSTCRAQVTKLCNSVSDYLKTFNTIAFSDVSDPQRVEGDIAVFIQRLKNAHTNLKKADEAMRASIKSEDLQKECETIIEYDDKAVMMIAQLEHIINVHFKSTPRGSVEQQDDIHNYTHDLTREFSGVNLKSFELKKFDGRFENWLPFWEQFKRAVHENRKLSAATKFNYLNDALVGKASATIAGFTPTEACYMEAISLLLEEFGNTDKIVEKCLQKLVNLKPVAAVSDIQGLRQLYNDVSATMRSLTALQVSPLRYDIIAKSVLLKAIPPSMRVQYHKTNNKGQHSSFTASVNSTEIQNLRQNEHDDDNLKGLLDFIKLELEALEKAQLSERDRKLDERDHKRESRVHIGTVTSLFTNSSSNHQCIFCKRGNHATKNCKIIMSIEQRKQLLRREGRCFRCANKNHNSKFCKAQWIKCERCYGRHITPMCERNMESENQEVTRDRNKNNKRNNSGFTTGDCEEKSSTVLNKAAAATLQTTQVDNREIFLQTAKAIISDVSNNSESVLSRIVMDNGSQRTYISERLAKELNLQTFGRENMQIIAFGKQHFNEKPTEFRFVKLNVKSQYSEKTFTITATVVPTICPDVVSVPKLQTKNLEHLQRELADNIISKEKLVHGINLLIGQDQYWQFNSNEVQRISENLVAVKTFFGWTVQGCSSKQRAKGLCMLNVSEKSEESFDIGKFWNLESVGITSCQPNSEHSVIKQAISDIKKVNDRYVAKLPWRVGFDQLDDNKNIALGRLHGLTGRLLKNQEKIEEYDKEIRELLKNGIAEVVPEVTSGEKIYYMPHKPVYREDKSTTKMRIVFDASSSAVGVLSLNDQISTGENLLTNLLMAFIKFRSNKIAMIADIEKAFLQIVLAESERDSHRFLWYESAPKVNKALPTVTEFRMTRVTFGVASSPFLLAATINKHLDSSEPGAICEKLKKSFYVDDLLLSEKSTDAAIKTFHHANKIMSEANFNLRKWNTNDSELKSFFPPDKRDESTQTKVLGINWCTTSDEISVELKSCTEYISILRGTKRNVMRAMSKVYDPLGVLGPFTVRIKILLQNIWKSNVGWDQTLNEDFLSNFQCWQEELPLLNNFTIKRCLSSYIMSKLEIHLFADASPKAYGAVAYARERSVDGTVNIRFICSKNRVAPINKNSASSELSLPKLELTAALMAARLKDFLIKSLDVKVEAAFLWTDSTIALNWISGYGKQLKPYVKARVTEINQLTNIYDWRHCQGKNNPADLLTRGIKAQALFYSDLWKNGPTWLAEDSSYWPNTYEFERSVNLVTSTAQTNVVEQIPIMSIECFSGIKRLLRVTSFVFRFLKNLKWKLPGQKQRKLKSFVEVEELTSSELKQAEYYWIKFSQQCHYSAEINALHKGSSVKSDSKILTLNPTLDNGVLKLNGRLSRAEFGNTVSNPIILPKHCHFSQLVVQDAHQATLHSGTNAVLAYIRKKYWIVQGRQLVKSVVQRCVICKRLHGKNASEAWTVLPAERVSTTRPFETTGVDFAGPLYVKCEAEGSQRKVYIMLLTCAAIRAVHLEMVSDMTVDSCMDALRRFIARRGSPATIISDNAKTFKRVDLELRKLEELMKRSEIQQLAAHRGITWKFIPERAAWWGGFWERLVRSVKSCLKATVGKASLSSNELTTLLAEVESVINSRPLTYISDDNKDLEPLTPAHFLINCNSSLLPIGAKFDGSALSQSWQRRQILIQRYLKRWREEYLQQLRSIHHNKSSSTRSIKVGDVVLVHADNKPRLQWRLAIVQTTYHGRDGRVRACDIRLQNQQVLKRPIQLLYPLEIQSSIAGVEDVENKVLYPEG